MCRYAQENSKFSVMKEGNTLTYNTISISRVFENLFSDFVESLRNPLDKCNLEFVICYDLICYMFYNYK